MTLTYEQKVYQWASGHYLDDDVPDSFFKLTSDEQFKYLKDNAWQFFEDCRGKDIHQYISNLSYQYLYALSFALFEFLTFLFSTKFIILLSSRLVHFPRSSPSPLSPLLHLLLLPVTTFPLPAAPPPSP